METLSIFSTSGKVCDLNDKKFSPTKSVVTIKKRDAYKSGKV